MNRSIFWIVLVILLMVFLLIFDKCLEGAELNLGGDTYYEKDGCIYLIGYPTEEEKAKDLRSYRERMSIRGEISERKIKRNLYLRDLESQCKHQIKIEKIRAKALENYLKASKSGNTINVTIRSRTILRNNSSQKNTQTNKNTQINKNTQTNKSTTTQKN